MIREPITYKDFNNVQRTDTFYFNLTNAELAELGLTGYGEDMEGAAKSQEPRDIMKAFKSIILAAYGEKTSDGKFIKSKEISEAFSHSEAYSVLFMKFVNEPDKFEKFVKKLMPENPTTNAPAIEQHVN